MLLLLLMSVWLEFLLAQSLQVSLSPSPKVNRITTGGTATRFFDSNIEDLSIVCTDENPEEPIVKVANNLWCMTLDAKKDINEDGFTYRNFLIYSPSSSDCYLSTPSIKPNQILYYSITPRLQVKLSKDNKVDRTASGGKATIFFDCRMKGISMVCVDGEEGETINKLNERLQSIQIVVQKGLKTNSLCNRFLLKRGSHLIYLFKLILIKSFIIL